ncbi:MAG TPA: restriction endonuclease [Mycobacteriales bacterium]|jgi:restriction system protein|nr:restriction endonuclease [Mycobacteriales bacterium]
MDSRRRQGELVRGVFRILADEPDGLPAKVVLARLEETVPPTEFEDSAYPSDPTVRRREKAVRFATVPFVKAGWLRKEKGVWRVTHEGLAAETAHPDDYAFAQAAVRLYREWKRTQALDETEAADTPLDEVPQTASVLEEAEESAQAQVRDHLLAMNPYDFQDLVAALLRGMGYHVHDDDVSKGGPDQGIDIIAYTDPLGTEGPRIKVQVKRHAEKITVESLRAFLAVLGTQDVGIYVTSGEFTREARREARTQESRRLTLVDRSRLFELWVEHYGRLSETDRNRLPLRPVYFLDPRA